MSDPAPRLHLVNTETGEIQEDERDILIDQLKSELTGKSLQIGKLKRELREFRSVEPESQAIQEVLDYWREKCKPRATIVIDGARWKAVRARMKDKLDDRGPWTKEELMLVVDGALLDPFWNGTHPKSKGSGFVLEAESIFGTPERVEKLRDTALGLQAQTGASLGDLVEVASELRVVSWKHLLRTCENCGHKRAAHAKADPNREGREACLLDCECEDFFDDLYVADYDRSKPQNDGP